MEASLLASEFNHQLRPLLDTIDRLGELGTGITLPRIVVVGDQSSGKSSVLEAISGVGLPQGHGTVTRCALVLQMKHSTAKTMRIRWPGQDPTTVETPSRVPVFVEQATKLLTQDNPKAFSNHEIQLTIEGPDCPDLTLVDLPGIVRKPKDGQLPTVVEQVRTMIRNHIDQPESIIAAVIPCGDLETSEALALAKEYDPDSNRTIGILTKPDLMDAGTDVKDVLLGQDHVLQHGYVAVKNRGSKDNNLSLEEARESETQFFEDHVSYSDMDPTLFGVNNLVEKLQPLLKATILRNLPKIRNRVTRKLQSDQTALSCFGEAVSAETAVQFVSKLIDKIQTATDGELLKEVVVREHIGSASVRLRNAYKEFDHCVHRLFSDFVSTKQEVATITMIRRDDSTGLQSAIPSIDLLTSTLAKVLDVDATLLSVFAVKSTGDPVDGSFDVFNTEFEGQYKRTTKTHDGHPVYANTQNESGGRSNKFLFKSGNKWHFSSTVGSNSELKSAEAGAGDDPSLARDWESRDGKNWLSVQMRCQPTMSFQFEIRVSEPDAFETLTSLLRAGCCTDLFTATGWIVSGFSVTGQDLLTAIRDLAARCNGPEPVGFPSRGPFHILMGDQIQKMREPSLRLCAAAHTLVRDALLAAVHAAAGPWPRLEALLARRVELELDLLHKATSAAVGSELDKEEAWLWTNNKYFFNTVNNMRQARWEAAVRALQDQDGKVSAAALKSQRAHGASNEEEEAMETRDRAVAYSKVVYKRVSDAVPMRVQLTQVRPAGDMRQSLLGACWALNITELAGLLAEDEGEQHNIQGCLILSLRHRGFLFDVS